MHDRTTMTVFDVEPRDVLYVTPTLLEKFRLYMDAEPDEAERIREDMIGRCGQGGGRPRAAQLGLDFERKVERAARGLDTDDPLAARAADLLDDWYAYRLSLSAPLTDELDLRGEVDFAEPGRLTDIKTTRRPKVGKYLHSAQHRCYMWMARVPAFRYIVCDFTTVRVEEYFWSDFMKLDVDLLAGEFVDYARRDRELAEAWHGMVKEGSL